MLSVLALFLLAAGSCFAYDLHTKALVPVKENARPAGPALDLVKNGELRFAVAWDPKGEPASECGPYRRTMPSITPALAILAEAFEHTFGRTPEVVDAADEAALAKYPLVLVLGDSVLARKLGYEVAKEPVQGFTIETKGRYLVLHGHDSSRIPSWNAKPWEKLGPSTGTYYAALDFAERFLGARYFFPGDWGTLWRPARDFTVEPVSYTDSPHFDFRGGRFHFNSTFIPDNLVAKWRKLLGENAVKKGDGSFVYRWREGGTGLSGGSHAPDPQRFGARHADLVGQIFYKEPYGHVNWYPDRHYPNQYDVTNLGLIDIFIRDIREQFSGPQPPWDTAGWASLNTRCISFGQCDTYMALQDLAFNRTVRELGLVDPKDIERARQPDGYLRNDAGCFANIWGRFVKAYAERVKREFGADLYLLVYYNGKFPPNDPRYRLPDNVHVSFCDHRLPRRLFNRSDREDILRIAKEWYEALGGRPVERAWLYTDNEKGSKFTRAINPEFTGLVPKTFGKYLGRGWCFFDCNGVDDLYHFYYAHRASFLSQWNPDFDVEAAVSEHWEPFYGKECGRCLKEFHDYLRGRVIELLCRPDGLSEEEKYPTPVTERDVARLETLLKKAEAAVEKGTVFEKRFRVFAYPWPDAFAKRRAEIAEEIPLTPEERAIWKKREIRIDSWDDVYTRYEMNPNPYRSNRSEMSLEFANELTRYTFRIAMSKRTKEKPRKQQFSIQQGRERVGFCWGGLSELRVNGVSYEEVEIMPADITPWSKGAAHGYDVKIRFPGAPVTLRLSLKAGSKFLRFELFPESSAAVREAVVGVSAVPSFYETGKSGTRFYGYRREIVTATRTLSDFSARNAKAFDAGAEDRYFIFRDADYDGGGAGKGVGPCAAMADFAAVESAKAMVGGYWSTSVRFNLKPGFERFRFAVYEDRDRPVSNAAFKLPR